MISVTVKSKQGQTPLGEMNDVNNLLCCCCGLGKVKVLIEVHPTDHSFN